MSRPLLSDKFFNQVQPPKGFWEKWGHQGTWSENLVPLYEWESVLFVGTPFNSQLPEHDQTWNFKVVVLEANAVQLQSYFNQLKSHAKPVRIPGSNSPQLTADGMPADPFAALGDFAKTKDDSNSEIEIIADPEAGAAEELLLLSEDEVRSAPIAEANEALPPEVKGSVPTADAIAPVTSETLAALQDEGVPPAPPAPVNEPPRVVAEVTTPPPVSELTPSIPNSGKDELSAMLFEQLKGYYLKSMFLKKEGNGMVAWRWDDEFHAPKSHGEPVSLGVPSPFRIVHRTGKSYHGHVVPGEIQEKFFDEWNQSQIPDLLTISPVIINDQVVGMLLSVADKHVNLKSSLMLSEKIAADLGATLLKSANLAAAS